MEEKLPKVEATTNTGSWFSKVRWFHILIVIVILIPVIVFVVDISISKDRNIYLYNQLTKLGLVDYVEIDDVPVNTTVDHKTFNSSSKIKEKQLVEHTPEFVIVGERDGYYIYGVIGKYKSTSPAGDGKLNAVVDLTTGQEIILRIREDTRVYWPIDMVDKSLRFTEAAFFIEEDPHNSYLVFEGESYLMNGDLVNIFWRTTLEPEVALLDARTISQDLLNEAAYKVIASSKNY